ncbi:hypothetical protein H0A36_15850 [Endozoicomonas sp. SM1973]|uniref:RNA ligase domain-containing protein n=1 Tax=Spartinivicinus marinus TaxID=2994442 RepID=A0A853IC63_9GAMM|nr:RNA ligase family protein [Spartinivicinus marinus]MCX4029839.1 hypothetical protein [Spartinivicinus marinus]NYZ67491.1 hypothetical protein [Spartinivicinus marinus]
MDKLRKYSSIENSYQDEFINKIIAHKLGVSEYFVQEKVHGANLSFWTDGVSIKSAKRIGFIEEDENFYSNTNLDVKNKYESLVYKIFKAVFSIHQNIKTIAIFGKLFGGGYPHPDVVKDKKAVTIQIWWIS